MDKEKQGKAVFVSFCIEQYAKAKNMSTESTKYWHLGPVDLYNELKEEL